jgi:beta-ureidopropionase
MFLKPTRVIAFLITCASLGSAIAADGPGVEDGTLVGELVSKSSQMPRKVVVGTVVYGPYGEYPGLDARLKEISELVVQVAKKAEADFPGKGLDLVILPESIVTSTSGPASQRAIELDGPVRDTFAGLARKYHTYLVAPMDLKEESLRGEVYSNSAVLFERNGEVAGIYRKAHPVAVLGTDELERGITPGHEYPVFSCDFGKLGIQICWDVHFKEGWDALAEQGAEIVAWPSASPATVVPSSHAARHRYYVASSTWRDNATIFEPTGMVAARIEDRNGILVHQIDLSFAVIGWSEPLRNGESFTNRFGTKAGYHYSPREDLGLFWSNDPKRSILEMMNELGLAELDAELVRNRKLQDMARPVGGSQAVTPP